MPGAAPVTVVETPEFLSATRKAADGRGTGGPGGFFGHNPGAGDLVQGTGGVRKLRWRLEGRGKRGGARVIYFYQSADVRLFALTAFAKNEREDLSQQDRNYFRRLTKILAETY